MAALQTDPLHVSHHGEGAFSSRRQIIVVTANRTLLGEESGAIVVVATDALVVTLPDAAYGAVSGVVKGGWEFIIINGGADGGNIVDVDPYSSNEIHGEVPNAAADSVASGAAGKAFRNTKATAKTGDFLHLVSDGTDRVYVVGGKGIWASEA